MEEFTITTNAICAKEIEITFQMVMMQNRSIKLGYVAHYEGYSIVQILSKTNAMKPEDIFFLGFYTGISI